MAPLALRVARSCGRLGGQLGRGTREARADQATLVVLLPDAAPDAARAEVHRLTPGAHLRPYQGDSVVRTEPAHVALVAVERAPDHARQRARVMVAVADHERRLVFVFVRDLEDYLRVPRVDPRYQVALGRVVAHELEHIRRRSRDHDRAGWFLACLTRDDLLSPRFGAR